MPPITVNIPLPGHISGATVTQTGEFAIIHFKGIDSANDVVKVFDAVAKLGAKRGTVFTGPVVDDHLLAMYERHAAVGTTHLGGHVSKYDRVSSGSISTNFRSYNELNMDELDPLNPKSDLSSRLCAHLNRADRLADATCAVDLLSGGFKFSDEAPADVESLGEHLIPLVNLLRCLWGFRASIVVGKPRTHLAEYWDAARVLAPRWPGFSPERLSTAMTIHVVEADRRAKEFVEEMERMDRMLAAKPSPLVRA